MGKRLCPGQGTTNFSSLTFTLLEPVSFLFHSVFGTAGLLGHGNTGFLAPGTYEFGYLDALSESEGIAHGSYSLALARVPDTGSTLVFLGMGLCAILAMRGVRMAT